MVSAQGGASRLVAMCQEGSPCTEARTCVSIARDDAGCERESEGIGQAWEAMEQVCTQGMGMSMPCQTRGEEMADTGCAVT
jgi:hypothetical protein